MCPLQRLSKNIVWPGQCSVVFFFLHFLSRRCNLHSLSRIICLPLIIFYSCDVVFLRGVIVIFWYLIEIGHKSVFSLCHLMWFDARVSWEFVFRLSSEDAEQLLWCHKAWCTRCFGHWQNRECNQAFWHPNIIWLLFWDKPLISWDFTALWLACWSASLTLFQIIPLQLNPIVSLLIVNLCLLTGAKMLN